MKNMKTIKEQCEEFLKENPDATLEDAFKSGFHEALFVNLKIVEYHPETAAILLTDLISESNKWLEDCNNKIKG